jgi:hypothetical protein
MRTQELFVVGSQLNSNEERTPAASTAARESRRAAGAAALGVIAYP